MASSSKSSSQDVVLDSERFHTNPFSEDDFLLLGDVFAKGEGSFLEKLEKASTRLMNTLSQNIQRDGIDLESENDFSIYTGVTGILLTFHVLLSKNPAMVVDESLKEMLRKFPQQVLDGRNILRKKRFTFLCGDAGPLVTAYIISSDPKQRGHLLGRLLEMQEFVYSNVVARDGSPPTPNELLYGRAGYLYSLLFLNQQFPQDPPLISTSILSKLISCIVEDGIKSRQIGASPSLHYEWHEKTYLGAAHGYVGILYILLKARTHMSEKHVAKVKESVDWVMSQQFPSGNLRSSVGSKDDKLVHWCHGAPGAIFLFLEAAKAFQNEKDRYLNAALSSGEVVWTRGILKRSYSLCHGTAGNAYALMALYTHTATDSMWLHRSCLFAQWCFSWGKHSTRQPDRPNSLFEGLAGSVYMLHDFHSFLLKGGGGSGSTPKFPAFELD